MPKKKKSPRRAPSPCPDPEKYILVKTKYRSYWRKKRGTVKPAVLNKVLTESASLTGPANKAANQLLTMLRLFTQRMILGRTMAKIAGAFKKTHLKTGNMNFSLLEGMDFQEDYPFHELCKGMVMKKISEDTLHLLIPVGNENVTKLSNLAEGYQLQAILLFGDPAKENGLRIDVEPSRWYSFKEEGNIDCSFSFVLPPKNRPWMVLLYVVCSFNVKANPGPQYRRMKVVKVGGSI